MLDTIDKAILSNIAKTPERPVRLAAATVPLKKSAFYRRVNILAAFGLINLDSQSRKGRKLASLTERGREALRA